MASLLSNIGSTLSSLGRPEEARAKLEEALQIRTQQLGERHPDVCRSLDSLGIFHLEQGNLVEARGLFERAMQHCPNALGTRHPRVGSIMRRLGSALERQGHLAEASKQYEAAVACLEQAESSPSELAETRIFLARALTEAGRDPQRAAELAEQAEAGFVEAGAGFEDKLEEVRAFRRGRAGAAD